MSCSYSANGDSLIITANEAGQQGNNIYFRTKVFGNQLAAIKVTGTEYYASFSPVTPPASYVSVPGWTQALPSLLAPSNLATNPVPSPTTISYITPPPTTAPGATSAPTITVIQPGKWGDNVYPSVEVNPTGPDGCVFLSGGGDAGQIPTGWFQFQRIPHDLETITINGKTIIFRDPATLTGNPLDVTTQVPTGTTMAQTALNIYAWLQNNGPTDAKLRLADYTIDPYAAPPTNARVTVKLKTIVDGSLGSTFDITIFNNVLGAVDFALLSHRADGTTGLSISKSNQAYGYIWFTSNPTGGEVITLYGVTFQFLTSHANPLINQIQINASDFLTGPTSTFQVFAKMLQQSNNSALLLATYFPTTDATVIGTYITEAVNGGFPTPSGTILAAIKILYNEPGIDGNHFTLSPLRLSAPTPFTVSSGTLLNGNGYFDTGNSSAFVFNTEVSDPISQYGTTMYQVPRSWKSPVTTDRGEYVLVFPFGFTSPRVAYIEEMDLVAISKGPAYQGVQPISISVYGQTRTYTSFSSNSATESNYVRVFLLTAGGGAS